MFIDKWKWYCTDSCFERALHLLDPAQFVFNKPNGEVAIINDDDDDVNKKTICASSASPKV